MRTKYSRTLFFLPTKLSLSLVYAHKKLSLNLVYVHKTKQWIMLTKKGGGG